MVDPKKNLTAKGLEKILNGAKLGSSQEKPMRRRSDAAKELRKFAVWLSRLLKKRLRAGDTIYSHDILTEARRRAKRLKP